MEDQKNKKKTLTISANVTKKIDLSSLSREEADQLIMSAREIAFK